MDERTRADVERAEAAIVEHYPRLVRLAYLVLPPSMGRHRRVLTAHGLVQRALPWTGPRRPDGALPAQRGPSGEDSYALVRLRTLRLALSYEGRSGRPPTRLLPSVPVVWGLRLFPLAGGADELALDRALSAVGSPVRAAVGLWHLEGLDEETARAVLEEAGVVGADAAQREAELLDRDTGAGAAALLNSGEFDPCTVQTRPTDLLRRRQRTRVSLVAGAVLALIAVVAGLPGGDAAPPATAAHGQPVAAARQALDPDRLLHTPNDQWADTSRVDFTAWPARGRQAGDKELLARALRVWAAPPADARITASADTSTRPPDHPPRLLYAGLIDNVMVVVFHDGERLVRYAEPEEATPTLHFARVDDTDVTTGAALVIGRGNGWMRYLVAPWVSDTTTRDLLAPDAPARGLHLAPDGVTDRVPTPPAAGADCGRWPVVQLRSSARIVENHAFLLTDLGDLAPVHLTYLPPPSAGEPPRAPREATGTPALLSWARTACSLRTLRGTGVRSVNNWAFAEQRLPEDAGLATWVCTRADTWSGPGRVTVQLQPPAAHRADPGRIAGRAAGGAACSRFGHQVVGELRWQAPSGKWYLLAAGSRAVEGIEVTGGVRAATGDATLAVRAGRQAPAEVTGRLPGGGSVRAIRP